MSTDPLSDRPDAERGRFATTRWSLVLAAGNRSGDDAGRALAQLCEAYWYPVYCYIRRRVDDLHQAQDLTQGFISHLLERDLFGHANRERGRFRSLLLTALQNYLAGEWQKARAAKRGGARLPLSLDFDDGESRYRIEPFHDLTPEKLFERRWVLTMLDGVLARLRDELAAEGRLPYFEQFKNSITGVAEEGDYDQAAAAIGITSAAAKQAAYRLRKRFRQLFREEVARTVDDGESVDEEVARLLEALG